MQGIHLAVVLALPGAGRREEREGREMRQGMPLPLPPFSQMLFYSLCASVETSPFAHMSFLGFQHLLRLCPRFLFIILNLYIV